ncbi:hypothetical protein RS130_08190 [Paraglaciecola aquimarina]|uniref:Uncharacterized protein n=1 Tax=Paraglaciecola aquimarina TaxID=1235557 RepID=A0ABU3SV56_9ALTE|nr:hypothetical protein [Paraglaciecola aquimarina]MDU0353908.1 hypothetical protein [Paraglaciecola aquimarina]
MVLKNIQAVTTGLTLSAALFAGQALAVDAEGLIGKTIKIEYVKSPGSYLWTTSGEADIYMTGDGSSDSLFTIHAGSTEDSIALFHVNSGKYLSCLCDIFNAPIRPVSDSIGENESFVVTDLIDKIDWSLILKISFLSQRKTTVHW